MGYTTHVTGQFTITPPLTWNEIKNTRYISDDWRDSDLVLRVTEEATDTADGQLIRKTASVLAIREIDEYRAYNLLEDVQAAVDAFPGHEWSGRLECEGEENTDLWRVVIRDGKAVRVEPRIVWPDEADGELDAWKHEAKLLRGITSQARLIVRDVPSATQAVIELRELLNP